jgi:hypothetical protein
MEASLINLQPFHYEVHLMHLMHQQAQVEEEVLIQPVLANPEAIMANQDLSLGHPQLRHILSRVELLV